MLTALNEISTRPALSTTYCRCLSTACSSRASTSAASADPPAATTSLATASTGARLRPVTKPRPPRSQRRVRRRRRSHLPLRRSPQPCPSAASLLPFSRVVRAVDDAGAAAPGNWAPAGRPVRPPAGAYTRWKCDTVRKEGDARVVTADLISRARAGNGDAFRELTEPYLRELQVHCYRMLGSFQDAEDALQNTLLTAWHSLGAFPERASLRTRLYRIPTNPCL